MKETLVSEPIEPRMDAAADRPFLSGEPVLPAAFHWRGTEYRIASILGSWKEYSPGTRRMPDRYLRKHWFHIRTDDGAEMKIYFEREARSKGAEKARWWLFTVAPSGR